MRSMCAITTLSSGEVKLCKALDALYQAYWVEGKRTHEQDVLHNVLEEVLGAEEAKKG